MPDSLYNPPAPTTGVGASLNVEQTQVNLLMQIVYFRVNLDRTLN